jgi:hypothetical protein
MKSEMRRNVRMTSNPPSLSIMNFHSSLLPNLSSFNLSSDIPTLNKVEVRLAVIKFT